MKLSTGPFWFPALAASTTYATCLGDQAAACCSAKQSCESQPLYPVYHIWKYDDNIARVSQQHAVSYEDLKEWNSFLDDERVGIASGTTMCVSTSPLTHYWSPGALGSSDYNARRLAARYFTYDSDLPLVTLTLHDLYGPQTLSTTDLPLPDGATLMTTTSLERFSSISALTPVTTLESEAVTVFMKDSCDAGTDAAEDCRISMDCDKAAGMYPTCENGICRCIAIACLADTQCNKYGQCRSDDEVPECRSEPILYPEEYGVCACRPRITDCFRMDDPNLYCGAVITCTEKMFSGYVEYAMCDTQDAVARYPLGRCSCHPVDCDVSGGKDPWEACDGLVACIGRNEAPYCSSRCLNDGHGRGDGYCACRTKEGIQGKSNGTQSKLLDGLAGLPAQVPKE